MAISLYSISVISFQQILGAVTGVLNKGLAYCSEKGIDPQEMVEANLIADMAPLSFQIRSVAHHTWGALQGCSVGVSGPPAKAAPLDYAGLQHLIAEATAGVAAFSAETVDGFEGKDMMFQMGDIKIPFTTEGYLMSFALPNAHFHATTAYDILRMKGVPLSKRDYLSQMRIKG